jgi:hypothetical protein
VTDAAATRRHNASPPFRARRIGANGFAVILAAGPCRNCDREQARPLDLGEICLRPGSPRLGEPFVYPRRDLAAPATRSLLYSRWEGVVLLHSINLYSPFWNLPPVCDMCA